MYRTVFCEGFIKLLFLGSANGASAFASTAGDALIGVDNVLAVAFGDRANGALGLASTAHDAFIADLISHGVTSSNYEKQ